MDSLRLTVASLFLIAMVASPIAQAAPAFVAAPEFETTEEEQVVLHREERQAGSGGGSGYSNYYVSDDEDYPTEMRPTRVYKPDIHSFHVEASITARFANTLINSKLVNDKEFPQEATFAVTLPSEAFISKFVMVIDDVAYEAEVKEKETAQREYNAAKERGQTAGQVKQHETRPNTFRVSVNVASYSAVVFNLTYQELLQRRHSVIEYRLNIDPGQVVRSLNVDVHITEPQGLQEMDAMWLSTAVDSGSTNDVISPLQDVVYLDKMSQNRAHIKFHPSKDQQKMERANGIIGNLLVQYDVLHDLSAGNLQVMNGYFVHYFSPEGLTPARKNVVFVIDVSGSMGGTKMDQTKEAMRTILADIREGDRLNIVTFTDDIDVWQYEGMADRTDETIQQALQFVGRLRALYGTNLHGGLMTAVDLLKTSALVDRQDQREAYSMIIMLTDGLPSSGVTNQNQIRDDVKEAIAGQFSLFCLGFGHDLDHDFLDNLASENQGVARKIYADGSASLQLKGFYDEVATPLLFNVNIEYNHVNSTTQTNFLSYFEGTEIIVAGQLSNELMLHESGLTELMATVTANSMDTFIQLETMVDIQTPASAVLSRHAVDDFCQRLWAYLNIKSLLKARKISRDRQEKEDLKARALDLSLRYHFVTPLTSLLVVRPEEIDQVPSPLEGEAGDSQAPAQDTLTSSSQSVSRPQSSPSNQHAGGSASRQGHSPAGSQRSGGGGGGYADSDPHFVVHVPTSDVTVCFDILGQAGEVFNLLTDAQLGIQVTGFIVAAPEPVPGTDRTRTYFGRIGIRLGRHTVKLSTKDVTLDGNMVLSWKNSVMVERGNWSLAVHNKEAVLTRNDGAISLAIMLHRMNPDIAFKVDHLGFYIVNHEGFSGEVHGLIGQFQRRQIQVKPQSEPKDGVVAELTVMDRRVDVVQRSRLNNLVGRKQPCWYVKDNAHGLIDGPHTDYLLPPEMMP
ncbi:inter-alpha-trypsin inhibitor heavy chain H3-like [Acanthaster planci]|uniref:Inter-alpha-trypsin inhibitor heavy chain H3-like n=1 Tax=Acanthaster planci TaxID=133434 RepID=A0A8B7ZJC6_ACAPL|nr:inter-alpha-trypsin inhibitor heavy chain H3-like [Acanthaster planci]